MDHDLKSGEYLTFVYDGNHTFEVTVYGCLGSKETRAVAQMVELSDSDSEEEDQETAMDVDDDGFSSGEEQDT